MDKTETEEKLTEVYKVQARQVEGKKYYFITLPSRWVEAYRLEGRKVVMEFNGSGKLTIKKA